VKKNLILLGMMGAGKSTLGKITAKRLSLNFIDTDTNIEKKLSMKISDIFKKKGEKFFRAEEEKEVLKSLEVQNSVIALGGGTFVNKAVRSFILKNAISIWLDVDLKTLNKRVFWNKKRPLLKRKNNKDIISKLYSSRKDIYKLANYKIKCNDINKDDIVKKIINFYEKQ
jgi:shikimate kinase